ncbi:MAG: hypothetical protein ACKV0T_05435 [Planctomycetales bacterium]
MKFDDGFILSFPVFTYLVSPGPVPGALQDSQSRGLVAPVWTSLEQFEQFRAGGGLPEQISVLQLDQPAEFQAFLRQINGMGVERIAIDVRPTPPQAPITWNVKDLLHEFALREQAGESEPGQANGPV